MTSSQSSTNQRHVNSCAWAHCEVSPLCCNIWVPQTRDRLPRKSVQLYGGSDGHQICPNVLYIDYTHQIYHEFLILDYFIKNVPAMFTWIINQLTVSKATTWSTLENCTRGLTVWVTVSNVYFSSKLGRLECPCAHPPSSTFELVILLLCLLCAIY